MGVISFSNLLVRFDALENMVGDHQQRIAMTLIHMPITDTRLATTAPDIRLRIKIAETPVCPMVRADRTAARCCSTPPKLRYVSNKQEVYVHGYQSRSRHELPP